MRSLLVFFLPLFLFLSPTNCLTAELFTNLQVSASGQGAVIATYTFSQIHPGPFLILYNGAIKCNQPPPPPPPPQAGSSSKGAPSTLTSSSFPSLGVSVTLKTSFGQMDLAGTAAGATSYDLPLSVSNSFYFNGMADQDNSSLTIQFQLATTGQLGDRDSYCSSPSTGFSLLLSLFSSSLLRDLNTKQYQSGMEDRHSAVIIYGTSGFGEKYYLTYQRPPFVGWLCRFVL